MDTKVGDVMQATPNSAKVINALGAAWINWVQQRSGAVLAVVLLLSMLSLGAFYQFGKLNSDLSKSINELTSKTEKTTDSINSLKETLNSTVSI